MTEDPPDEQAILNDLEAGIRKDMSRLRRANPFSLEVHRSMGGKLRKAKSILKWQPFLAWAESKFDFRKAWVSRLMWLHKDFEAVQDAIRWAGDRTDTEGARAKYSPDGAWRILNEKKKSETDEAQGGKPLKQNPRKETPKERMARELATAHQRIAQLVDTLREHRIEPPPAPALIEGAPHPEENCETASEIVGNPAHEGAANLGDNPVESDPGPRIKRLKKAKKSAAEGDEARPGLPKRTADLFSIDSVRRQRLVPTTPQGQ